MKKQITVAVTLLLMMLCSCSREGGSSTGKDFLAAKAETVISDRPHASEETALQYLQEFAAGLDKRAAIPGKGRTTVKYYTGVSHSSEGLVVNGGRRDNPSIPPDKSYYHEFHYDIEGKLSHIVANNAGARSLSALFYYEGINPMARICFVNGKHSYSDLACYNEGGMFFKCRIASDGKVLSKGLVTATK